MFEKMSDGNVAVYLKNETAKILAAAQELGINIDITARPHGYACVRLGGYEVSKQADENDFKYSYMPVRGGIKNNWKDWKENIDPQSIRFSGEPEEEEHGQ